MLFFLLTYSTLVLSLETPEFEESKLSDDMDKLYSNVSSISTQNIANNDAADESKHNSNDTDTQKFEKLASMAINKASDDIKNAIKDERENMELNDKIFNVTLNFLKKFWFTGQCGRDYSAPCPKALCNPAWNLNDNSWTLNDNICTPGDNYNGNCRSYTTNAVETPEQKQEFAFKCKADWPCINPLPSNYNTTCPYNWVHIGNNYCLAPYNYSAKCSPFMNFSSLSNYDKAIWSMECDLIWPQKSRTDSSRENMLIHKFYGALSDLGNIVYPLNY